MITAKSLKLIVAFLLAGSMVIGCPCEAQIKVDGVKSGSKIQSGIQKLQAKCQSTMESIQGSQFGQFVGDGVKYAKEGIAFAKKAYEDGMAFVTEAKEKVEDSKALKATILSKEIADETLKLKALGEEVVVKQEEIRQEYELIRAQNKAKHDLVIQNQQVIENAAKQEENNDEETIIDTENVITSEDDENDNSKSYSLHNKETLAFAKAEVSEQDGIGKLAQQAIAEQGVVPNALSAEEMSAALEKLDKLKELEMLEKIAEIAEKYAPIISAQTRVITEKTKELKELTKKEEDKEEDAESDDPKKSIGDNVGKFFSKVSDLKNNFASSLGVKAREEIKRQQEEYIAKENSKDFSRVAGIRENMTSQAESAQTTSSTSETMPGESENSGVNTEVLAKQIETLQSYVNLMIADLQIRTTFALKSLNQETAAEPKSVFNLCDYTDPSNVMGAVDCAKSAVNKANETAQNVKSGIEDGIEKAQDIKNQVEDGTEKAQEIKEQVEQGIDTANNAIDQYAASGDDKNKVSDTETSTEKENIATAGML